VFLSEIREYHRLVTSPCSSFLLLGHVIVYMDLKFLTGHIRGFGGPVYVINIIFLTNMFSIIRVTQKTIFIREKFL
jgi:hypothetical protein